MAQKKRRRMIMGLHLVAKCSVSCVICRHQLKGIEDDIGYDRWEKVTVVWCAWMGQIWKVPDRKGHSGWLLLDWVIVGCNWAWRQ